MPTELNILLLLIFRDNLMPRTLAILNADD